MISNDAQKLFCGTSAEDVAPWRRNVVACLCCLHWLLLGRFAALAAAFALVGVVVRQALFATGPDLRVAFVRTIGKPLRMTLLQLAKSFTIPVDRGELCLVC